MAVALSSRTRIFGEGWGFLFIFFVVVVVGFFCGVFFFFFLMNQFPPEFFSLSEDQLAHTIKYNSTPLVKISLQWLSELRRLFHFFTFHFFT